MGYLCPGPQTLDHIPHPLESIGLHPDGQAVTDKRWRTSGDGQAVTDKRWETSGGGQGVGDKRWGKEKMSVLMKQLTAIKSWQRLGDRSDSGEGRRVKEEKVHRERDG